MFLRRTKRRDPVPVTMAGVRMGERLLQVGIDDPAVAGAIAAKVGLSGSAAAAVTDDDAAARFRRTASDAGVLIDVQVSSLEALPFEGAAFDVVLVHSARGQLAQLDAAAFAAIAREWHRVLRPGGRIVAIEPGERRGLGAVFGGSSGQAAQTIPTLEASGFRPVRVVGDLEGLKFTEGLRP